MINSALQNLKTKLELNPSFNTIIQQKHNAVRSVVENKISGARTKLIGSLQKNTRIQPKTDDLFDQRKSHVRAEEFARENIE